MSETLAEKATTTHDSVLTVTYQAWRDGVDLVTRQRLGVRLDDLPDLADRDAYDAGSSIGAFFNEDVVDAFRRDLFDLGE